MRIHVRITLVLILTVCFGAAVGAQQERREGATYTNPVVAGDYPDPSVIRTGPRDFWATATMSEWAPIFPLMHSRDLVNWRVVGSVFGRRPAWAARSFWAPEIAEYKGRFFVYYTARKPRGPLCVAVATAAKPQGPYADHGPMVCQEAGSIDAFPTTDENGERYLLWKEDGNSRREPTPLWAQKLDATGTKLVGEPREIMRNDAWWESHVVEGSFVLRRNGWFYMFYSGNACCGRECNYALGVARSKKLLGPWEKNPANPILQGNDEWKCPGHGSVVTDERGRDFLLYHAYDRQDFVYTGRQALLDQIDWPRNAGGWPTINAGRGPSRVARAPFGIATGAPAAERVFFDDFKGPRLAPVWLWPQNNEPIARASRGTLSLSPGRDAAAIEANDRLGAVIGLTTTAGDYSVTVAVDRGAMRAPSTAGLAAYGDRRNAQGVTVAADGVVKFWYRKDGAERLLEETRIDAAAGTIVYLRMRAEDGGRFSFDVSANDREWKELRGDSNGENLPAWDSAVRIALTAGGSPSAVAKFKSVRVVPGKQ